MTEYVSVGIYIYIQQIYDYSVDLSSYKLPEKTSNRKTERGELLVYFRDRLNETRDGKIYKKLTIGTIAVKLGHLKKVEDLYYLKSICDQSKNFGATFWYSIKVH